MNVKLLLSLSLLSLLACGNLSASEDFEDDLSGFESEEISQVSNDLQDDLDGFGDEVQTQDTTLQNTQQKNYTLSGNFAFKTSVGLLKHQVDGVEYSGINKAQTALYLQFDSKLSEKWKLRISTDAYYDVIYDIYSTNKYNNNVLNAYKTQLRFDDTYIQGQLSSKLDLKLGRQIVIWGKSDTIRITDIINPMDNRELGLTDIEDLRLPTTMAKLDYYLGMWNLSAMLIGESRIMQEAPPRSEFFAIDTIFPHAPNPFFPLQTPTTSTANLQYAFAANGVFSGWDLSFYAADVLDQKWHIRSNERVVSNIQMFGSALNIAIGSWLLKTESAYIQGVQYNTTQDEKNRFDTLAGFDYMGFKESVISLEIANRHIFNYEIQMTGLSDFVNKDEFQSALRINHSLYNDTLNITALATFFGSKFENGGFNRIWLEYDIIDALSTNIGFVDYFGGEKPYFESLKNNDRFFADITYNF